MKIDLILERLGLGKNAGKIYRTMYDNGEAMLVLPIAKKTGLARQEVYRNLEKLLKKKFIIVNKEAGRTYYSAASPRLIYAEFESASTEASTLIDTMAKKRERLLPAQIRYFKGFNGIRAVFDDAINETPKGQTFYRYTSEQDLQKTNKYLSPTYRVRRDTKKLERLVISNPLSGQQKRSRLERFIKFIPPEADLFQQNIIQLVYADNLAFINLNAEEAFIIKDPALASFQKVIFKQLYKRL